jgi:hypothetical protein
MASELAIREKLESLKARMRGIHAKAESGAAKMQRKLAAGAAAYYYGTREVAASRPGGAAMPTVAGLRPSVAWALALFAAGEYAGGRIAELADGASDGMIGVAAYNMGRESANRTRTTPGAPGTPPGP